MCVCVYVCMRACVRTSACVFVRMCVSVFELMYASLMCNRLLVGCIVFGLLSVN